MSACADKVLLLGALVDGELDAANTMAVETHVASCAGCAAELARLRSLDRILRRVDLAYDLPAGLVTRVTAAMAGEAIASAPPRTAPRTVERFIGGGALATLAAGFAAFALIGPRPEPLESELIADHVRSLQVQHLVDVPTSDRHVVKPWFNGKIDFAPPVFDLAAQGFPLVGGRLDYLRGRTVAALVYRRRAHVINLFVQPGSGASATEHERKDGYTLLRWRRDGLEFWAVSDIDPLDLAAFHAAYAEATAG